MDFAKLDKPKKLSNTKEVLVEEYLEVQKKFKELQLSWIVPMITIYTEQDELDIDGLTKEQQNELDALKPEQEEEREALLETLPKTKQSYKRYSIGAYYIGDEKLRQQVWVVDLDNKDIKHIIKSQKQQLEAYCHLIVNED